VRLVSFARSVSIGRPSSSSSTSVTLQWQFDATIPSAIRSPDRSWRS
jgi:hypothetical protein